VQAEVEPVDGSAQQDLDLIGLDCPEPVLRTRERLQAMAAGDSLVVVFDDPLTELDLVVWCERVGHPVVVLERAAGCTRLQITRGPRPPADAD
jgi:tRNA 2-thiouridine synthesizing protein A